MRILRATALYHLGELDKSQAECGLALEEIPDYQHNYRTRIQFLLARISLRRGDSKTARELVKEALSVSREHFYFPLIAEGHLLAARCIAELLSIGVEKHQAAFSSGTWLTGTPLTYLAPW